MTFGVFNKENWFRLTKISIDKRCPNCGSKRIRRSHRYRWIENILHFFHISPFRCTNFRCQRRFLKLSSWF
jgi:ssDNA-binding Zn-finger/Zn-ribbon topoisomerase 1